MIQILSFLSNPFFNVFSFILVGGIFGIIGGIIKGAAARKKANLEREEAAKARAHEERMANIALQQKSSGAGMSSKTMLLIGGGVGVSALVIFMMTKKR